MIDPHASAAPVVSICVPVYNGERFLADAIDSVLRQTWRDFELLVFDDASTDRSPAILAGFADPRLSYRRNPRNLGPERNWNRALEAARGRYVKLFHQDDVLAPICLERQVAALEDFPAAALCFCGRTVIRAHGGRLLTRTPPWRGGLVDRGAVLRECVGSGTNPIGEPTAVLFRAEVARRVGAFNGRFPYVIDLDYWLRLLEHGSAVVLPAALASFRVSSRQWSATLGRHQAAQFVAFIASLAAAGQLEMDERSRFLVTLKAYRNQFLRQLLYRFLAGGA